MHAHFATSGWNWEPSILLGLILIAASYALVTGPFRRRKSLGASVSAIRQGAFYLGTLLAFLALLSPLDELSDEYLFSAHMLQHILITFVAPSLWLLGIPDWLVERLPSKGLAGRIFNGIARPLPAFLLFNSAMWLWHIPFAYNMALEHEWLHIVEHLIFVATGLIAWWPVIGWKGKSEWGLSSLGKGIYTFLMMFPCTALAALITLSSRQLYTFYGDSPLKFGLTPIFDQQVGGLLMWLPPDLIFMLASLIFLNHWLSDSTELSLIKRSQRMENYHE